MTMAQLNMFLPPYSSDFSGVLSALFDLGGLLIVHDASCCTKNYSDNEEPRWGRGKNPVFCSKLRSIDAVMGNDEKLIGQAEEAIKKIAPPFAAVLGTPVPSIIGTDLAGIANEIEAEVGVPTMGFETSGFFPYDCGISAALLALLKKFAREKPPKDSQSGEGKPKLNLMGLTPLDYSYRKNEGPIRCFFEEQGFEIVSSFAVDFTLRDIARARTADVSLVLTSSALEAAQYLYRTDGIPYVCGAPMGKTFSGRLAEALRKAVKTGEPEAPAAWCPPASLPGDDGVLIIWEQTMAASLRQALLAAGCRENITVATLLPKQNPALSAPGDLLLKGEEELIELLGGRKFRTIIADPLILNLPSIPEETRKIRITHPALSSRLFPNCSRNFLSPEFEELIEEISQGA